MKATETSDYINTSPNFLKNFFGLKDIKTEKKKAIEELQQAVDRLIKLKEELKEKIKRKVL